MSNSWRFGIACLMLAIGAFAASPSHASAERWPGTSASIGGAIAARVIAVKCTGNMTSQEIAELDTYIDEHQTAFMSENAANQRLAEAAFPRIARNYDHMYSRPESCTEAARAMARDMLTRVRAEEKKEKQARLAH